MTAFLKAPGLEPKRTSVHSPWQDGVAERWVGSCQRELVDNAIALNEQHLGRLIREYVAYRELDRIHDSLEKDMPNSRAVQPKPAAPATVLSMPRLGGLYHCYGWREPAWSDYETGSSASGGANRLRLGAWDPLPPWAAATPKRFHRRRMSDRAADPISTHRAR